jgi:hypothetical protein
MAMVFYFMKMKAVYNNWNENRCHIESGAIVEDARTNTTKFNINGCRALNWMKLGPLGLGVIDGDSFEHENV